MIDSKQLVQMSQQSIEETRKETLVDISTIKIDDTLTPEQKVISFLEQIKNPYCFLCGNTPVRVCYADGAPDLGEILTKFFIHLKQG